MDCFTNLFLRVYFFQNVLYQLDDVIFVKMRCVFPYILEAIQFPTVEIKILLASGKISRLRQRTSL